MENSNSIKTECSDKTYLERVRYFPGQLITADDMLQEQKYLIEKQRRHNRFIHGWGIVCGLTVKAAPTSQSPWNIVICPGYALGPGGDEIFVGQKVDLDLATCLSEATECSPCDKPVPSAPKSLTAESKYIYIVIKYTECLTRPQRVLPAGCGCDESACEYSRIRDSFKITCLPELSEAYIAYIDAEESNSKLRICPPCPPEPWLVLAKVIMPAVSDSSKIDDGCIDENDRKMLPIIP